MAFTTRIDTSMLAGHLSDPAWIPVDCRFRLDDSAWGQDEYGTAHIPGAWYAHLDRDLSGVKTGANGRHPLPDAAAFRAFAARLGISPGVQVVAYDQDVGVFASRLWWLLRWSGHDGVAVLDGGFAKWTREGRPTASGRKEAGGPGYETWPASATANEHAVFSSEAVASRVHDPGWTLLDARAPERYRGESEPLDRVPGHIPGAVNRFYKANLQEDGTFLSREELRAGLQAAIGDAAPQQVICYCGSGVTACHNLLAMEHAGLPGAKLYPGSWSEWSSDPQRPVERS